MAALENVIEILVCVLPKLIPFVPMYILSKRISIKTGFKLKSFVLITGWVAALLETATWKGVTFYLAGYRKLLIGVVSLGNFVLIAAMILIYTSLSEIKSTLFPDAHEDVLLKVILALVAVSIPFYLLLSHLNLGIDEFLYMILWPISVFLLSINCFEVTEILKRLKVNSWVLGGHSVSPAPCYVLLLSL